MVDSIEDSLDILQKDSKNQISVDTLKLSESSFGDTELAISQSSKNLKDVAEAGAAALGAYRHLERNPFVLPSDEEVFKMRENDKLLKLAQREARKNIKVWQKAPSMYDSGMNISKSQRLAEILEKGTRGKYRNPSSDKMEKNRKKVNENDKIIPPSRARGQEKENMAEFIAKKREMFLVQMSLDTKREEIRKLEQKADMKEDALRKSEQMLEEDAVSFDTFLKENDKRAHDAIKAAEDETKSKNARVTVIKKLNQQIQMIQSEMSKHNEALQDCEKYKEFLDALTPAEFFEDEREKKKNRQNARRQARMKEREDEWEMKKLSKINEFEMKERKEAEALAKSGRKSRKKQDPKLTEEYRQKQIQALIPPFPNLEDEPWTSSEEELPMYFTHPQQLLDIFLALEEQNLFLIQNSQETEQALEELKQNFKSTKEQLDKKTSLLKDNINELKSQIASEDSRADMLRKRIDTTGGDLQGIQGRVLASLHKKVTSVFETCGGNSTSSPSTLFMLSELEARLEEMLGEMEKMPNDYVHRAEKEKEKKRREKKRQEQQELQERQQEERNRKSMERSLQAPKKRIGRQVMHRSKPIRTDKREEKEEINEDQLDEIRFLTADT